MTGEAKTDKAISSLPDGLWSQPPVDMSQIDLGESEPIQRVRIPATMRYTYSPGKATTQFLRALKEKRFIGDRCPTTDKVYVPPSGMSPIVGRPTIETVELGHTGTVTTFCVVDIDFTGGGMETPYVSALVLPDGADIAVYGLVSGVAADEVYSGQRVGAVWVSDEELTTSLENIKYWTPIDEPDVDLDELHERGLV